MEYLDILENNKMKFAYIPFLRPRNTCQRGEWTKEHSYCAPHTCTTWKCQDTEMCVLEGDDNHPQCVAGKCVTVTDILASFLFNVCRIITI